MSKGAFHLPMTKKESVIGWIYVFVHAFGLVFLLNVLNAFVFPLMGFILDSISLNLTYYIFGFVFLLISLFHYLKESFADLCSNLINTLTTVIVGYVVYFVLMYVVTIILGRFVDDPVNPNSSAIITETKLNPNRMLAVAVLLAPIVEETLFRGVVFGTIRRKSRIAAYLISSVFFSFYHLWQYMFISFSPTLLLYLIEYIPAGLVLGWCYERGKSVWCPIFLHMVINYVSTTVTLG